MTNTSSSPSATANVAIKQASASSTSSYKIQWKFAQALSIIRSIPLSKDSILQPNVTEKLKFYGLYKQALEGDNTVPRPSSRQVVEYAKWKSWSRMKGIAPIEAQRLYVESLIQLLTEFIHRYPHHAQTDFLQSALRTLQQQQQLQPLLENDERLEAGASGVEEDEEFFQDAYDPREFEQHKHFLNDIEADQIMLNESNGNIPLSPPPMISNDDLHNQQHVPQQNYYYPLTPITSPSNSKNSVTGQWVLNQLDHHSQQHHQQPILDYLTNSYHQHDLISDSDTLDREVAAITRQHYQQPPSATTTSNNALKSTLNIPRDPSTSSLSSPSDSLLSSSTIKRFHDHTKKKDNGNSNNRALERLQTEITALTEQMDRLRQNMKNEQDAKRISLFLLSFQNWRKLCWRFIRILIKHMLVNSAILLIVFYALWRRKSPIAYSILNYLTPLLQDMLRKMIRHIVFWKVTV